MKKQTDADRRDLTILQGLEVNGLVRPEDVVTVATANNHPWHDRFEWDDSIAAHQHRLTTAREIIRSVRVRIIRDDVVAFRPAYVRSPVEQDTVGYRAVDAISNQRELALASLDDELQRIKGNVERARSLAEAFGLRGEFEFLLQSITSLREKLRMAA